nr:Chain P, MUCIN [Homo sapiens]
GTTPSPVPTTSTCSAA